MYNFELKDNEKVIKFKSYVSFYKSIVDQDKTSVVICNLKHEIIYMNPAYNIKLFLHLLGDLTVK